MRFKQLVDFINNKMKMSHVYQPVMLMCLLEKGKECSETEIAEALLSYDQIQIEYYEKITSNMVGRVLESHRIIEKEKKMYRLTDHETLTPKQKETLLILCKEKLMEYIE